MKDYASDDVSGFDGDKDAARGCLRLLCKKLSRLQELLYAEAKHKVLVVLQGMDTAGKDGTIKMVFRGVNPQGVTVQSFKTPTEEESSHDYLWRIHRSVPGKGRIAIFNRSHYEDVLITRVHSMVSKDECGERYSQINDFERMLSEEGTVILKFFLHIDKDEQKKRLQARLDDPRKQWKFSASDVAERKFWDDYVRAYEVMLGATSTDYAPWYVIPADKKWYRNLLVASIIVDKLKRLNMKYPKPAPGLSAGRSK